MSKILEDDSPLMGVLGKASPTEQPKPNPHKAESAPAGVLENSPKSAPMPKKNRKDEESKRNTRISIAVTEKTAQALKDEAWEQHRSVNDLLVEIVEEYLKKQNKRRSK